MAPLRSLATPLLGLMLLALPATAFARQVDEPIVDDEPAILENAPGHVMSWGYNSEGQLGNDSALDSRTPVQSGISGVQAIAGGYGHSLALRSDGTVWAWGYNDYGQLGKADQMLDPQLAPDRVHELTDVTAIAAGDFHSLAVKTDGSVWTWGRNTNGQLGNGTTADSVLAVQVVGLDDVVAVSARRWHSLALKSDGSVWSWGGDFNGQLGNDVELVDSNVPVQVANLSGIVAISSGGASYDHNLALASDGTVWGWGSNEGGAVGASNGLEIQPVPGQIPGLNGVTAISAAGDFSLALKGDGTVWAWGYNYEGQLGLGTPSGPFHDATSPTQIPTLSGVTAIAGNCEYALALKADGTVWSWGSDSIGALGQDSLTQTSTPLQIAGLSGVQAISAGYDHGLALTD